MALRGSWRKCGVAAALVSGAIGCSGKGGAPVEPQKTETTAPVASINASGSETKPGEAVALDPKQHQPFDQACTNEIPADSPLALPPDVTANGKKTGLLNDAVARLWDQIRFVDADGKRQTFVAELEIASGETTLGTIEMVMQPELAPNHVRNFVALATLQYYDGLHVDRIVEQQFEGEDGKTGKLALLEAGAPLESAEPERCHLGYWLKPEFNPSAKHEEGTVGACLLACEGNEETAAVRFYINLTSAPAMDGNFTIFAKVTKGLDVARHLVDLPHGDEPGPDQGRPKQPITIRKVTIRPVAVQ